MIEHGPCPHCGSDEEKVVVLKGELAKACAKCGYIYYLWKDYCSMSDAQKDIDSLSVGQIEDALQTRIAALSTRVAEFEAENVKLKAERRWIPCTEQMPKDNEYVLVYCSADGFYNIDCLYDGSWLEAADYYEEDVIVTHWMPLPEPPEVKDE